MAQLFLDSFDHYVTADIPQKWTQIISAAGTDPDIGSYGRRSSQGLRFLGGAGANGRANPLSLTLTPADATCIIGFAWTMPSGAFASLPTGFSNPTDTSGTPAHAVLYTMNAGSVQTAFQILGDGTFRALNSGGTFGTSTKSFAIGTTYYIEIKVTHATSGGTIRVRVDGDEWLTLSSLNTGSAWNQIVIGRITGSTGLWYYDDLYVADGSGSDGWTDFMGDMRIDATFPTSDGTHSDFTRSTGANQYATIDEASANGDSDYNSSGTNFAMDTLNFPNAPVSGATILGLQVVAQAKKADAGPAGHKAVVRIGSTDYTGTEHSLASSYSFVREQFPLKPSDNTAWTDTDYNAAEFGYQKST